jgi:hypothetical protein
MNIRQWILACAGLVVAIFSLGLQAEDAKPSGTISVSETEVGFLITGDWGHGTLTYNGEKHMFHMGGGKIGGIGAAKMQVDGTVYNLTTLDDFAGTYFKAEAGITGGVGKGGSWLKNSKGVKIHMSDDSKGLALQIGVGGLKLYF